MKALKLESGLVKRIAALLLVTAMASGCVTDIFNGRVTVSTSDSATGAVERLGAVQAGQCNYMFIVIPIVRDPRNLYDKLMQQSESMGGNAVVDFELRSAKGSFWMFPIFLRNCFEAVGQAAKIES